MHSVSDLTTYSRKTTGDVPPKLVGASTTVVGNKVYLYGGRLVTERRMVTDMFIFDLHTHHWDKMYLSSDDDIPAPRYFHSADAWNHYLIIFGGMGLKPDADTSEDLCVLNDVRFFDLNANRWMPAAWSLKDVADPPIPLPKARYAHLTSISGSRLFIVGGQDLNNVWLDDVYVFDLQLRAWVSRRDYPRHCGTYRSVAVSGALRVRMPQEELRDASTPTPSRPSFRKDLSPTSHTNPNSFTHLPYSAPPTDDFPANIYLYSNYNFTDVKRELEVLTPLPGRDFSITDQSNAMGGTSFPPGLRFPTGAVLGHHLIIAGTYLAHSFQSHSVWALNLLDMTWSRIDPGSTLSSGSWFRSCLWADANKFIVFGNRHGNLVDDYNRRLLSWDHIAVIDLEAFGIYQPPRLELDIRMQEMGLAALEEGVLADFEIICDDDRRIKVSRKLLEDRWPWFREQRRLFLQAATKALEASPQSSMHAPLPDIPGQESRPDPRLSPRALMLSEPYPITMALVQYLYSLTLLTPLQHAPAVLSALLVISTNYDIPHLQNLVKHAMHRALSNSTSVGVYEVATLCSCRSLQIRALKTVMLYNQKRPSGRSRQDKDGSGSNRPSDASGHGQGGGGGGGGGEPSTTARPRGMSDAQWAPRQLGSSTSGSRMAAPANYDFDESPPLRRRGLPPAPITIHPPHRPTPARSMSIVSMSTHDDLTLIGEMLSPVIAGENEFAAQQEQDSLPLDEALEARLHGRVGLPRLTVETDNVIPPGSSPTPSRTFSEMYDDSFDHEYLSVSGSSGAYNRSSMVSSTPSWHRDSDTPSLTSSTSRSSLSSYNHFSPPVSPGPAALVHAIDAGDPVPFLSTINESDGYPPKSRLSIISVMAKSPTLAPPSPEDLKQMPTPETIRLKAASPVETVVAGRVSPAPSSSSSAFNAVFGRNNGAGSAMSVSDKSTAHSIAVDAKARKAADKLAKKEEAKARKERLAAEFAAKANRKQKEADAQSTYSSKSDQRKHRKAAWEEDGAMYGNVGDMVL